MSREDSNPICLECGLCCNGVIFATGQLQPGDDAARLAALGLRLAGGTAARHPGNSKFHQPCSMFDGCRCRIYADRPVYCRKFECLLLKSVQAGDVEPKAALQTIRQTLKVVSRVHRLLQELGEADEAASLSVRFRRTRRRVEAADLDRATAALFGELTVAMHELILRLNDSFYRE